MIQYIRFAVRSLLKAPGFSAVVVLTLALGIGATTAIFSVVYATLLRPLPYPQADRIVSVRQVDANGNQNELFSELNFRDVRDQNASFSSLAEYASWETTVTGSAGAESARRTVATVSNQFFASLGVQPILGRRFTPEEARLNGTPVALVSYSYWQSERGGVPGILGTSLTFDGKVYSVVGVMPPGFRFPAGSDLWTPLEQAQQYLSRTSHNWHVIGRLKPDVTLQRAQLDVSRIARAMKARLGDETWMSDAAVISLRDALVGHAKTVLLFLLEAAGILLAAACANTANLLLVKVVTRQKELAVRVALGSSRGRLFRQIFAETCVLSLVGGAFGVLIGYWGVNSLLGLESGLLPGISTLSVNLPVLAFSTGLSLVTAGILSVLVALRAGRRDIFNDLKGGEQRQAGNLHDLRVRAILMASQVAMATLLAGAGLLGRSLLKVMDVHPGYRTDNVLSADVFLAKNDILDIAFHKEGAAAARARRAQLIDELVQRVRAIPGIDSAGVVRDRPLSSSMSNGTFILTEDGDEIKAPEDFMRLAENTNRVGYAWYQAASPGYFTAMQIPSKRGRLFDDRDGPDAPQVALISESLARQRWPGQDPLGRHIEFGNMDGDLRLLQIVGVVGDVRNRGLEQDSEPTLYVNARQRAPTYFSLVMHATVSPIALIPAVRAALREVDSTLDPRFQLFPQIVSVALGDRQFQLCLLGVFAGGALLLAVLGLYGVTAYAVQARTREIGVRMALGAQTSDVIGLIMKQGGVVVAIGIGLGLCMELALTGVLRRMLYGITALDPFTLATVCGLLMGLTLIACWLPARRATHIDPLVALRHE